VRNVQYKMSHTASYHRRRQNTQPPARQTDPAKVVAPPMIHTMHRGVVTKSCHGYISQEYIQAIYP